MVGSGFVTDNTELSSCVSSLTSLFLKWTVRQTIQIRQDTRSAGGWAKWTAQ